MFIRLSVVISGLVESIVRRASEKVPLFVLRVHGQNLSSHCPGWWLVSVFVNKEKLIAKLLREGFSSISSINKWTNPDRKAESRFLIVVG